MDFLDTAAGVMSTLSWCTCIEMILVLILVGWTLAAGIRAESVYGQRVRAGVAGIQAEMKSSPEKKTV
jgi:hypothetical protein